MLLFQKPNSQLCVGTFDKFSIILQMAYIPLAQVGHASGTEKDKENNCLGSTVLLFMERIYTQYGLTYHNVVLLMKANKHWIVFFKLHKKHVMLMLVS